VRTSEAGPSINARDLSFSSATTILRTGFGFSLNGGLRKDIAI